MTIVSFIAMMDNGGRRLKTDRRKKTVPLNFPDRRSGRDRRTGVDRRTNPTGDRKKRAERRSVLISSPGDL